MGKLYERLSSTGRVPTPPGVVVQLLELTERDDATVQEIADTIALDPGLAGKILRFANSPLAGVRREVSSLPKAVALMGVRGVKMSALSFAVLGTTSANSCKGFDARKFTTQSVCCGVSARILSTQSKIGDPQDAFLAGLLSQLGRAVLANGLPDEYAKIIAELDYIPRDLPPMEKIAFGETYANVGADLLRSWKLPEQVTEAIDEFRTIHEIDAPSAMAKVLYVAELACGLICPDGQSKRFEPTEFMDEATRWLAISKSQCETVLNEIASESESLRVTLDLPEGNLRSADDLQEQLRERIAELSLAMHMENQSMADRQQDLMRRATTDPLTEVGNRSAFDARMSLELDRANRGGSTMALLLMDVDHFKSINDTFGHQAGDKVLQMLARTVDDNIRKVDFCARYGGEEFAVIAPEVTPEGTVIFAERLRKAVEAMAVTWESKPIPVTVSIGVAVASQVSDPADMAALIRQSDERLYAAKQAGRNCIKLAIDGNPVRPVGAGT